MHHPHCDDTFAEHFPLLWLNLDSVFAFLSIVVVSAMSMQLARLLALQSCLSSR